MAIQFDTCGTCEGCKNVSFCKFTLSELYNDIGKIKEKVSELEIKTDIKLKLFCKHCC